MKGFRPLRQAHYINNRTMEVFRGIGGLAAAVKDRSPPLALWRNFVYCESLTGQTLGSVDHFEVSAYRKDPALPARRELVYQSLLHRRFSKMWQLQRCASPWVQGQETAQAPDVSPEPVAHLSQNRLAALLAQDVHSSLATDVHTGCSVTSVSQDPHGGVAVHGSTASGQQFSTACDYLVLADGANSRLRWAAANQLIIAPSFNTTCIPSVIDEQCTSGCLVHRCIRCACSCLHACLVNPKYAQGQPGHCHGGGARDAEPHQRALFQRRARRAAGGPPRHAVLRVQRRRHRRHRGA